MKLCTDCWNKKEESEFGKDKQKFDGLNQYCKECIRKRSSRQRKNNPTYAKEYATNYREKNRIILREKSRLTFVRDREKRLEQSKNSYYKHQEEIAKNRAVKRRTPEGRKKSRERATEWRKKTKRTIVHVTRWKKDNPEKSAIHSLVVWAIKTGVLVRKEECEQCGLKCKTQGHHEDYSKPLEVIWLCTICHGEKHRKYR